MSSKAKDNGWVKVPLNQAMHRLLPEGSWLYRKQVDDGILNVVTSPDQGEGFHLSISHTVAGIPGRFPTWEEILEVRDRYTPHHVEMVMYLPTRLNYVNLHDTTFHLWSVANGRPGT